MWSELPKQRCLTKVDSNFWNNDCVPKARSNCTNTSAGLCLLLVHVKGGPTNPISSKLQSSITLLKFSICQCALVPLLRYSLFMRISLKLPNTNHGRWSLLYSVYLLIRRWLLPTCLPSDILC